MPGVSAERVKLWSYTDLLGLRTIYSLRQTTTASDGKPSHAHVETAQPVEPVAAVEPGTRLTITRDEAANAFVYRSIDRKSGEVVWQYPVEQVLRMAHRLRENGGDARQQEQQLDHDGLPPGSDDERVER